MRILVVGAGAVGGYFGGRLVEAKRDVTFLVRHKRAEEIDTRGLQIFSPHGNLSLRPRTVTAVQLAGPYDLILLAVKSYTLLASMNDFAPAVGPETMILPALNGMGHIDLLAARFGADAVLGGVCLVAAETGSEGQIRQLADFHSLTYGELSGEGTRRLHKVDATLRGSSFDAEMSPHIVQDMWQKWVQLATWGAITCLMRGNLGEVASIAEGSSLSVSVLRETSGIATACGYPPSEAFLAQQTALLMTKDSEMAPSMYRDLKSGVPVEADAILGDLLRRAKKYGLSTPILQAAFVNLSIYQTTHGYDRDKGDNTPK
jgi:2-dehydropantoate 2-reductase